MNLDNHFWYFQSALSNKFCDQLVEYALSLKDQIGLTGNITNKPRKKDNKNKLSKKDLLDLRKKRDSNVVWLDERWIYNEVQPYIHTANKNAGWNFEFDFTESCQFTKYHKGQFYGWHTDSWEFPYNKPDDLNIHGKIRKLSVTISLSDPKDYKGGDLEFQFRNKDKPNLIRKCPEVKPKGSIVVFPSFVWHRVKPVTKGTRYSLVCWNLGYPFR
tara:strand:- start:2259 stop:2903 length:645 start_codon:yes stop_codon:yes gene_type:complete